ncbi:IS3 family transposase [Dysosmobacter welbionis]
MRISIEEKQTLVARYRAGESVADICADTGVPRSTFYTWIKPYTVTMTDSGHVVSQQAFIKMKQKLQKLEQMIEILQKVNCTVSAPLQEKLQELAKLHGQYSVHALCEALCVSRGTFYNHIFRRKEVTAYDKRRAEMKEHIQTAFDESQQRFGANKIAAVLADRGVRTSPKYVAELMREMGLQSVSIYSKRDYQKSERLVKKQNMLQRQFKVDEPNCVWVSDITCFKVNGKYLYICVILDLFSRKVVAHRVSPKNSTYLVTSTFRQAYRNRNEPQQLMFHSDQGPQYTSNTFRKLLRMNKVVQSFSKSGRPHDNAVAESFFASMKREEVYRTQYCSEHQFMRSVDTYIEFYNTKRPHSTLNYKTPDGFELLHAQRREHTG